LNIHTATRNYEAWLGEQMPLLRADLALKHRAMRENALRFLRGTFYRWSQVFLDCRCGSRLRRLLADRAEPDV
jgi:hypothetical protein